MPLYVPESTARQASQALTEAAKRRRATRVEPEPAPPAFGVFDPSLLSTMPPGVPEPEPPFPPMLPRQPPAPPTFFDLPPGVERDVPSAAEAATGPQRAQDVISAGVPAAGESLAARLARMREEGARRRAGVTTGASALDPTGGFPGAVAGAARAVVPQGVRDVAGTTLKTIGEAVMPFLSEEAVLNMLAVGPEGPTGPGGLTQLGAPPVGLGTQIGESVEENVPGGRVIRTIADVGLAPVTLLTAGFGPEVVALLRGPGFLRAAVRAAVEPLVAGGLETRIAAETALGTGAVLGTEELQRRGVPAPLALAGGLLTGVGAVGALRGGLAAGRAARPAAEAVGREARTVAGLADQPLTTLSGVGDAIAPQAAPRRVLGREVGEGVTADVLEPPVVPPELDRSLRDAATIVEVDKPGVIGEMLDSIPGLKQTRAFDQPRKNMSDEIMTGHVAEGAVDAEVRQTAFRSYIETLREVEQAFGREAIQGEQVPVRFLGTADEAKYPATGTFYDIAQRPEKYDLTDAQRAVLPSGNARNDELLRLVNEGYGAKLRRFQGAEGSMHLPNVDVSAAAEEAAEAYAGGASRVVARGRDKTRIFETGYDRWVSDQRMLAEGRITADQVFTPETDLRVLLTGMNSAKARAASGEVFRAGAGGKTRIELIDELHPRLRETRDGVRQQIANLRNRLSTAERQEARLRTAGQRAEAQARQVEQRAQPMLDRLDELGEEWGPELSYLSGQVRELNMRARALSRDAARFERQAEQAAIVTRRRAGETVPQTVASVKREIADLIPELDSLRRSYDAANLRGNELVQEGIYRYFPAKEAAQVRALREVSTSRFVNLIAELNATVLSGDLSPWIGVQGQIAMISRPYNTTVRVGGGLKRMAQEGDPFAPFRAADELLRDPEGWNRWAFYSGRAVTAGTPGELSGGFLQHLPGFRGVNEGLYVTTEKNMKNTFEYLADISIREGAPPAEAYAAASDTVQKMYPVLNPRRLGQSARQAKAQRTPWTSIAYLRNPPALTAAAVKAYVKTGLRIPLTEKEKMARQMITQLLASVTAISATAALADAKVRNIPDVKGHVQDAVINQRMWIPGTGWSVPIGSVYRSVFQAARPRMIPVQGIGRIPVPFAGLPRYFTNRFGPSVRRQIDIGRNKDYYGELIQTGDFPLNILQALAYEAVGVLPLTAGQPFESLRRGDTFAVGAVQTVGQFLGGGVYPEFDWQRETRARDELVRGRTFTDPAPGPGEDEEFTVKSFDELATRLGTVAARIAITGGAVAAMAGAAAAGVGPSATIEDLDARREAEQQRVVERGIDDADAAFAFLADVGANREAWSFDIQQQLDAGTLTKGEARKERKAFLEGISGQYTAVRRVFAPVLGDEGKRDLTSIDGARDAYFALFEEANIIDEETGRVVGWDSDRFFDDLEPKFIAEVGPEMWAHVQANTGQSNRAPWELEMAGVTRQLGATEFFDIRDKAWADMLANAQFFPGVEGFETMFDWRDDQVKTLMDDFGLSRTRAEREVAKHPFKKAFDENKNLRERRWIIENTPPGLAQSAIDWNYLTPTNEELNIVESFQRAQQQRELVPVAP